MNENTTYTKKEYQKLAISKTILEEELYDIKQKYKDLEATVTLQRLQKDTKISSLNKTIEIKDEEIKSLKIKCDEYESREDSLKKELNSVKQESNECKLCTNNIKQIQSLQNTCKEYENKCKEYTNKCQEYENNTELLKSTHQSQLNLLNQKITGLEGQIKQFNVKNLYLKENDKTQEYKTKINELKQQLVSYEAHVRDIPMYKDKIDELSQQLLLCEEQKEQDDKAYADKCNELKEAYHTLNNLVEQQKEDKKSVYSIDRVRRLKKLGHPIYSSHK